MDIHKIYKLKDKIKESPIVTTYVFEGRLECRPWQFYMVWLPDIDEKPFSIWYVECDQFYLSIARVGPFTTKMESLNIWDRVGFRGPFWNWFDLTSSWPYILVGWWVWVPPVAHAAQELVKRNIKVDFIEWARSKDYLIYEEHIKKFWCTFHACTDDWSEGYKGFPTDYLDKILKSQSCAQILTCWPELMMRKVAGIAKDKGVPSQLSLEWYMKCGFWVCGECCAAWEWKRVCEDGPVFDWVRVLSWF